jgi:iron complex transport system ATP-binding protein
VKARDRHIVENADLSVETGEFVGLIGPNGAGKSTLLRAMLGLRPRISGSVMLDGETMEKLSARERACAVAYLPQDRHVEWRLPARDIVRLGRYPHRHRFGGSRSRDEAAVDRALALVEVEDLADRPVASLSGGERTRVLLARALAVEAPLLLADEPIAALDPYHQLHVMEILRGLSRQGVGVLCVIHDLALAMRFSDRLVLMGAGRVLADGPPRDVLSSDRLETIYRIDAQEGERHGSRYLVPWSRI